MPGSHTALDLLSFTAATPGLPVQAKEPATGLLTSLAEVPDSGGCGGPRLPRETSGQKWNRFRISGRAYHWLLPAEGMAPRVGDLWAL